MSGLVVRDNPQLRRIERAIAELEARPAAEQRRREILLAALHKERAEIVGRPSPLPPAPRASARPKAKADVGREHPVPADRI